ncbi:MAG: nuclear transport factor 2 family protein [Deltaproteobacteria bacterium]|nr:nuclear transport factor 2 family protein [Deltaproteobacteria bacterium]
MKKPEIEDEGELLRTEQAWVQAHMEMDLQVISEILDDEYTQLKSDGKVFGKQELIDDYSTGTRYWEIAMSEPVKVQIMGEVGLLFGKWLGKGENNSQPFDYSTYFLAVYRKRDNKWKLVADASLVQGE